FFDDVRLPPDSVVGDVNDGWTVALALLGHERNAVGGGSPYVSGRNYLAEGADGARDLSSIALARSRRIDDDAVVRPLGPAPPWPTRPCSTPRSAASCSA